jgi:NAD(P)-dependent dehydrogenase (short-subunit alcohol dehydrogenase family)
LLNLKGRTAVVTGAASGIGRAIATSLARRGCNLALADVNDEALARTTAEIAAPGVRISKHHLDVSDRDAVAAFPDQVTAEHRGVDVLVNNAGVALAGTFEQVSETDFEWLFGINFWGVVRMTRAFLPLLHLSDDARIVNLSPEEDQARRKSFEAFLTLPPATAGETIVRGIENRKARILVGSDAKMLALIERLAPVNYWNLLGRRLNK